jgi:hypothetical protein
MCIARERADQYMQGSGPRRQQTTQNYFGCQYDGSGSTEGTHAQGLEEPLVLPARVPVLKQLLDCLLRVLALRNLLEGVVRDGALEPLELKCVSCREKVGVVHDLWKRDRQYGSRKVAGRKRVTRVGKL